MLKKITAPLVKLRDWTRSPLDSIGLSSVLPAALLDSAEQGNIAVYHHTINK